MLARARYPLALAGMFGVVILSMPGVLIGTRAVSSSPEMMPRRSVWIHLTPAEERNYEFRLRQLEQDLRRDPNDFEVLRRLGQLHLQLASGPGERRGSHLRRARFYLRHAADLTMTSRDAQIVRTLLDAANSPNPLIDVVVTPAEFGPQPRMDEEVVRMRLGWLEEQVGQHPASSRLLCRLADNYAALYRILKQGGGHLPLQWPSASSVDDPAEARRLAELGYDRALASATTNEARCRALYGIAQLQRAVYQPEQAAGTLRQLLALQPNNWFVALELARLSRQIDRPEEARHYEQQSARWRTPGWI